MIKKAKKKIYNFLRWSQKYTKTDMVYLVKGSFWLNIGQGISSIAGLALTIAFANLIPAETYGTFKFVISITAILSIPTLAGMNTALVRAVAQGNEGTFFPILKTKIKWGSLSALASLLLAGYYYLSENLPLAFSFLAVSAFLPFVNTFNIWINYLNGKRNFKKSGEYQSFQIIIRITILIFTLFFTQNLILILFIHFISQAIIRLSFLYFIIRKYPPNKKRDSASVGYGKHLSLMGILGTISNNIDKVLLFHFLGPINLAVYSFALRPIIELKKPLSSLTNISLPKLSQKSIHELKKTIPRKMIRLFLVLLPFIGFYILIAPLFFKILFPNYTDAVIYSQIYVLSLIFFPKMLMGQALTAHAQKKQLYILTTITPTIKIVLLFILLPIYGVWGAILTLVITDIIHSILLTFIFIFTKKFNITNNKTE